MIGAFAQDAWHFLFGWAGVDMLVGFACVAVAVLTPPAIVVFIPDLRKWAIYGAVIAFTCMGCIAYGFKNGSDEKQRQWDAAQAREAVNGEKARSDAERAVPDASDRRVLDADPRNRDGGKRATEHQGPLRRLAPDHLFGR